MSKHEKWEKLKTLQGDALISSVKNYFISRGIEQERLRGIPFETIMPRNSWRDSRAPVRHPIKGIVIVGHTGITIDSKTQTKSIINEPATQIKFHTKEDEKNNYRGHVITLPNIAPTIYIEDELSAITKIVDVKYEDIDSNNQSIVIPDQLLIISNNTPGRQELYKGRKYKVEMTVIVLEENFYREIIGDKNNPGLRNFKKVQILPVNFIGVKQDTFAAVDESI